MSHEAPETNSEKLKALYKKLSVENVLLENLFDLFQLYQQNLHEFQMRAAKTGTIHIPIDLHHEIEETQSKINELKEQIVRTEHSITRIKREIEKEEKKQIIKPLTHHFSNFLAWHAFNKYAENAQNIFVAGGSLDNLIQLYGSFLVKKTETGCEVRLIFMDPESPAIPQVELWSSPDIPQDYFRRAICRSLRYLAECDKDRKLKIRLDPSIPAMTVVILDGDQLNGRIRVDLQPFQAVVIERPVFELTRQGEDEKWYEMFYQQYSEELWSKAKPVDLSNLPSGCS